MPRNERSKYQEVQRGTPKGCFSIRVSECVLTVVAFSRFHGQIAIHADFQVSILIFVDSSIPDVDIEFYADYLA